MTLNARIDLLAHVFFVKWAEWGQEECLREKYFLGLVNEENRQTLKGVRKPLLFMLNFCTSGQKARNIKCKYQDSEILSEKKRTGLYLTLLKMVSALNWTASYGGGLKIQAAPKSLAKSFSRHTRQLWSYNSKWRGIRRRISEDWFQIPFSLAKMPFWNSKGDMWQQ